MKAKSQPADGDDQVRSVAQRDANSRAAQRARSKSQEPDQDVGMDQSPEAATQRRLQNMADTSPQTIAQRQQLGRMAGNPVQRAGDKLEDDPTMLKAANPTGAAQLQDSGNQPVNQTGLPDSLKSGIESLSGLAMDDVKVHYNSAKPATLQALAYTQGSDIHVGPGQEQHLAHEAWHVAQQKSGRVQPTMQAAGTPINDDTGLEHEADVMGAKALQRQANTPPSQRQKKEAE